MARGENMDTLIKSDIKTLMALRNKCRKLNNPQYQKIILMLSRDINKIYGCKKSINEIIDHYDIFDDGITAYININGYKQIWEYTFNDLNGGE